jgi:hypothetical protein
MFTPMQGCIIVRAVAPMLLCGVMAVIVGIVIG